MYSSMMGLLFLLPSIAIVSLVSNQSHFLMALLSLEGVTLSLVLFVPISMSIMNAPNVSVSVILLTFGACEASLGLSLMVMMSRSYGTDMLSSLTMNKC